MRRILCLLVCICIWTISSFAQGSETFTNIPASSASYATQNWTGDNGLAWTATDARTDQTLTGKAICIRVGAVTCNNIPNGLGTLSFKYQQVFTGNSPVLEARVNGSLVGTFTPTTTVQTATINNVNATGNFNLELKQTTSGLRIIIDDITWTAYNGAPCVAPTVQPTNITFGTVTNNTISGSFTAASPAADEYLVVRSNSTTLTALPVNGTTYATDDVLGNGVVVNRSNATNFSANTLSAGTTYYFFVFSISSTCSGGPLYLTTNPLLGNTTTTAPPVCATPTTTISNLVLTPASTTVNGTFTAATGADGYLVVRTSAATLNTTPTNGTNYTEGSAFGNGTVVKFGGGNTFAAAGLTSNTAYYFHVFAVSGFSCTGGTKYNTTAVSATTTTTTSSTGEPVGYYNAATGLTCANLKTALKNIITTGNNPQSYADLWTQYAVSDIKPREVGTGSANVIWDIYSDNPTGTDPYNYTPITDQCGNYSGEGACYNREHSFPLNWFNGSTGSNGAATDYHHIFPTDGKVNGVRSNFIYGEVATASYTSQNGSKLGSSSIAGFTGNVFEPINAYKGDVARAFLYMVTRYENDMTTWGSINGSSGLQALEPNTFPSVDVPYLKLMIKWHNQDPVSQKEIDRNNAAYAFQGNRNPFIDHPEYVSQVWGSGCPGLSALPANILFFTGKLIGNKVALTWESATEINLSRYEIERSTNGVNFSNIGQVKAGNSKYGFADNAELLIGRRVYYRLKKVDLDGSFSYSEVFTMHIPLNIKFVVYPNPANAVAQLSVSGATTEKVTLQVTDLAGKIVYNSVEASNNLITINTTGFANGTYTVRLISGVTIFTQKLVVLH